MSLNHYYKRLKSLLKDKTVIFWTLLFPLLLATLFSAAFSGLDSAYELEIIKVAVVNDSAYEADEIFSETMKEVSKEGDDQLFELTLTENEEAARQLLKKGDIEGYIKMDGDPKLFVTENGINQTVMKGFLDNFLQTKNTVTEIIKKDPSQAQNIQSLISNNSFTKEIPFSSNPPSEKVTYFYALMAMVCMYGCFHGLNNITSLQGNLSPLGARRMIAPISAVKVCISDFLAGVTVQFGTVLIAVFYLIFVLGTSFGDNLGYVILTCLIGSLLGVSFGSVLSISNRMKVSVKVGVLLGISMICSFLSGLMVTGINYTIAKNAPIIAWINPAARITDAFYCLYYYDSYEKYFMNISVVLLMSLIFLAITIFFVRRQRYESV